MRKHRRLYFVVVLLLLLVVLGACAPSAFQELDEVAPTQMQQIYQRTYNGTVTAWKSAAFWAPLWWGLFWATLSVLAGGAVLLQTRSFKGGCALAGSLVGAVLIGAFAFAQVRSGIVEKTPTWARSQATHAMTTGFDGAIYDKADHFAEILTMPIVDVAVQTKRCEKSVNRNSNCHPYEWTHEINRRRVCRKDSDGDEHCHWESDTEHVPYFKKLVRYYVVVELYGGLLDPPEESLRKPDRGTGLEHTADSGYQRRNLSGWKPPQDYKNQWFSSLNIFARTNLSASEYTPPADWQRYKNSFDAGIVETVVVYHRYADWLLTADNSYNVFAPDDVVSRFEAAGLIPHPNVIYSRIGKGWPADYDFVQFLNMDLPAEVRESWQTPGSVVAATTGNDKQVSVHVVFAPSEDVSAAGGSDLWAAAVLTALYREGANNVTVGGVTLDRVIAKNMFILLCVVENGNYVPETGCRLISGMPRGNEAIVDAFAYGEDDWLEGGVQFTPEAFYGHPQATYVDNGGKYPEVVLEGYSGTPVGMLLREPGGVVRVSMEEFDFLSLKVELTPADVDALVNHQVNIQQKRASAKVVRAFTPLAILYLVLGLFFVKVYAD